MSVAVLGTKAGQSRSITKKNVMAGLVPAIHVLTSKLAEKKAVDARHKAGHDEQERS
jgi:hypothetical protein